METNKLVGWAFALFACVVVQGYVLFGEGANKSSRFKKLDETLGRKIFDHANNNKSLKSVATLFSLLGELSRFGLTRFPCNSLTKKNLFFALL